MTITGGLNPNSPGDSNLHYICPLSERPRGVMAVRSTAVVRNEPFTHQVPLYLISNCRSQYVKRQPLESKGNDGKKKETLQHVVSGGG